MSTIDDLYEVGEGMCGRCGALLLGSEVPRPGEVYECSRPGCGNQANYEDVVKECADWYREWFDYGEKNCRKGDTMESLYANWKPSRPYRFKGQLIGRHVFLQGGSR